jgi:soluble lytic murein transglycosylase-like protein
MAYDENIPGSTIVPTDQPQLGSRVQARLQNLPGSEDQNQPQSALPVNQPAAAVPNQQAAAPPPEQPPVTAGTRGQPPQAVSTVQSEPTPQINKPPFDPRPYAWLAEHNPQLKAKIDDAAQLTGVDPDRIAWHAWKESKFKQDDDNGRPVRSNTGAIGLMQLMPGTAHELSQNGRLDPFNQDDNLLMGAQYIAKMDAQFGKNSPSSFAAYYGGPGGIKGEKTQQYAASAFPGAQVSSKDFVGQGSMTAPGLVQAGTQGGPDGFLRYAVDTAPAGMPMSDAWRHAEALLVGAFVGKGDMAGAQHAKDWVFQMSHVGTNQNLMAAHQALSAGDGVGASQYLAKAHAFFPDGTIGRFRSDGKNVYAERLDENDPSHRIGSPMMITPQDIAGQLNQTTDPEKYLATLSAQQKLASETRLNDLHGQYYAGINEGRERAAELRANAQVEAANTRADAATQSAETRANATVEAANIRAQNSNAGAAQQAAAGREANKDAATRYDKLMNPDATMDQLGDMSEIHKDAMMQGATGPQAERIARGISNHSLQVQRATDGTYAVIKAGDKTGQPIGYLSKAFGDHLAGAAAPNPQQGSTSAIGAGASTPYAMGAGVTNNLTGTVMPQQQQQVPVSQSSALPVK